MNGVVLGVFPFGPITWVYIMINFIDFREIVMNKLDQNLALAFYRKSSCVRKVAVATAEKTALG